MIAEAELDRIIERWLAEGGEMAPQRDIDAALAKVAATHQRRPSWSASLPITLPRWVWIAAAALVIASMGVALTVGTGLISLPRARPEPPVVPAPALVDDVPLTEIPIEDRASRVSVPPGWSEIESPCCDYREFAGTEPLGHLSVGHESPYTTSICVPGCHTIEMPLTIPYSADRQVEGLRSGIEAVLGSDAWEPLPAGVLPELRHGARLEASGDDAGGVWHRVVVAGLRGRNVVAIAWSQPEGSFDPVLMEAVIAAIELLPAPTYTDGDLIDWDEDGPFSMRIPGFWWTAEQPMLDDVALSGAYRFGEGNVFASIGSEAGELAWCDPDCTRLAGMTSLDALQAAVAAGRDPIATPTTIGGEPGVLLAVGEPVERRYALAMHGERPFAMLVDTGDWEVADGIPEEIIASVEFAAPPSLPTGTTHVVGDGLVTITLGDVWRLTPVDDAAFAAVAGQQRVSIRIGSPDGLVTRCGSPAGPWETCEPIRVATLEELVSAVSPGPDTEDGIGPPIVRREDRMIGEVPVVVLRIQAYEPPARGGQEVVYVVGFVGDRPVVMRFWTGANQFGDLASLLDGITFGDTSRGTIRRGDRAGPLGI